MKYTFLIPTALLTAVTLSSCNSKLGVLSADNFTVVPAPLEATAGQVPATINGRFPAKYMKKKAVVTVIPELRYAGKTTQGQAATFQGEKIVGNHPSIAYKVGGNYVMKTNFAYVPEMAESELYLTFKAKVGKKDVLIPAVKIADGVNATAQLVAQTIKTANTATAADAYQKSITQQKDAQIKYLINQAKVRSSELKGTSVQDFVKLIRSIKADQKGFALDNIEVAAYASPEGKMDFNNKLAEERQKSASAYIDQVLKKEKVSTTIDTRYTAEDWEGFQELVAQSNIQDKDVIIRVLAMYKDPEQREQEIRNLSLAFRELANEILPELRRSRMTLNYRIIGRTDTEIQTQFRQDATKLSIEELLYAATLTKDVQDQEGIFSTAVRLYPQDWRAYNGLAQVAIAKGDYLAAQKYLEQAGDRPEVQANAAMLALIEGKTAQAEMLLGKAVTAANYKEVLGNLQIAKGNYAQAAQNLKAVKSNSAALAQILNKDYTTAVATLNSVPRPDAVTQYLQAVLAARTGNTQEVLAQLRQALSTPELKKIVRTDMEFAKFRQLDAFQALLR